MVEMRRITEMSDLALGLSKWLAIVVLGYFGWRSIQALAGQTTTANFAAKLVTELGAAQWIPSIAAIIGIAYGLVERYLRKRDVARVTERNIWLETQFDVQRTSSSLTAFGNTNQEDKR